MQPTSIRKFEIFYLAAWGVSLIVTFLGWDSDAIRQSRVGVQLGLGTYAGIIGLGLLLPPTLCWLAARKRSNAARGAIVLLFCLQALGVIFALFTATFAPGVIGALGLLIFCLRAIAIRFLFGVEASAWFQEKSLSNATSVEELEE